MKSISVLIADDHTLIREAWELTINAMPGFTVLACCGNGNEAVDMARALLPNIVLMDINLPGIDGIEATQQIRKYAPGTKVLAVSSHTHPTYARRILQIGASGYLTKNASAGELFEAMKAVANDERYVCHEMKDTFANQYCSSKKESIHSLTQRELEIVKMVSEGGSSKEIAQQLFLSVRTIEVHRHNILRKLNLSNSASLVNFAHRSLTDTGRPEGLQL